VNNERYSFQTNESYFDFEFESHGPNGQIKKVISYTLRNANGVTYFNLGFGDWNELQKRVDDISTSDNKDTQKILATVAATVVEITAVYPDLPVYAKGSTPARTRLYQMGISANFTEIELFLDILALRKDGEWETFQKGVNYEAFIARRKQNV
jgi:hypothetical protein